jgi:ubiquitin carboxyl-terminal hydrolase 7
MLVYIQKSRIEEILTSVRDEDVPKHLHDRFAREEEENERKKKEEAEASRYASVRILTPEHLQASTNQPNGFGSFESVEPVRVAKDIKISEFKEQLAMRMEVPTERVSLVVFAMGRPDYVITPAQENEDFTRVFKLPQRGSTNRVIELFVHVQPEEEQPVVAAAAAAAEPISEAAAEEPQTVAPIAMTGPIFFKQYDPESRLLKFVGVRRFPVNLRVSDMKPFVRSLISLPDDSDLLLYDEYIDRANAIRIDFLQPADVLKVHQFDEGGVVAFQAMSLAAIERIKEMAPTAIDENMSCLLVKDFYHYLLNRVVVKFAPLNDPENVTHEVELLRSFSYDAVQRVFVKHFGAECPVPAEHVRFTGVNPYSKEPRPEPFRLRDTRQLRMMLQLHSHTEPSDKLFYEFLEMPLREIENKKELLVAWYNEQVKEVLKLRLIVDPNVSVEHVAETLLKDKLAEHSIHPVRPIRFIHVEKDTHKIRHIFANHQLARELPSIGEVRAEEISQELLDAENEYRDLQAQGRRLDEFRHH